MIHLFLNDIVYFILYLHLYCRHLNYFQEEKSTDRQAPFRKKNFWCVSGFSTTESAQIILPFYNRPDSLGDVFVDSVWLVFIQYVVISLLCLWYMRNLHCKLTNRLWRKSNKYYRTRRLWSKDASRKMRVALWIFFASQS